MKSSLLWTGIGLRAPHYADLLERRPQVAWLEVHSENYFGEGGQSLYYLEKISAHYPISFHGVSLSIGGADELNWQYLKKLRDLIVRFDPCLISDHLSWSSINGHYLHDLLPLPYTEESLSHIAERVLKVQEYLNRQILLENISNYIEYSGEKENGCEKIPEAAFLVEIAKRSGCGILLDINNIYVTATNLGLDPKKYIKQIPAKLVQEIHLAGFTTRTIDEKEILIDTHNCHIVPAVWDLYAYAIHLLGHKPTIIEWDADIPTLETLYLEAYRAEKILRETYVATKFPA